MGDVIHLGTRPQARNTAAERARRRLAAATTAVGGHTRLAHLLTDRLGWTVRPDLIQAWESRIAPPADALLVAEEIAWGADSHASSLQSFRLADMQGGGGHLYDTVVMYLRTSVAPRLLIDHEGGRSAFTAAAALTEMAGWMAHDAGHDQAAERHFARSLDLIRLGDDDQLGVHILTSMSHLAHHRGDAQTAMAYAQQAQTMLSGGPKWPGLKARVLAMQARGFAALGQVDDCTRLLLEAERSLDEPSEEQSPWISHFDHGSLACEAARALRHVGDLTQARRNAEMVIDLRRGDRTRSRAFGQLILATVLIAQGKPEEACDVAHTVLDNTRQLASAQVMDQLLDLVELLQPFRGGRIVAGFLSCFDEAMEDRIRLTDMRDGHTSELMERS